MSKYTPEDVTRIANFMRSARGYRPFALLTGAGCSKAAGIPLAGELLEEIKGTPRFAPALAGLDDTARQDYGKVMARLGRNERKDLLTPHLEGARINWAHIAIAALMGAGYVTRVLTFNFDNVLARACGICGLYPATYDFVTGASASTDHIVSPAIIHLHGQGYGLSMLNSESETADHAEKLRPLIESTLGNFPLLAVGYSGQADKVFPVLREAYRGDERLFWAGYGETPDPHVSSLIERNSSLTTFVGGADADLFLVQIAQQLDCWPPALFVEPIDHIRNEIEPVVDFPSSGDKDSSSGIDLLEALRGKLDTMERDPTAEDPALRASVHLMKGDFDAVIEAAEDGQEIPASLRFNAYINAGNALSNKAEATGDAVLFDAAGEKYAAALEIKPDSHEALYNWGNALSKKAKATGEAVLFDVAGEKYAAALEIKPDDHEALSNWGAALAKKAAATGDAALLDAAVEKYAAALEIKPDYHEALNNWGSTLSHKAEATGDAVHLEAARDKFAAALKLNPDKAYNMACLCALTGDLSGAKRHLLHCQERGTLPGVDHLRTDSDLDPLRELDWFKELLAEAEKKQGRG